MKLSKAEEEVGAELSEVDGLSREERLGAYRGGVADLVGGQEKLTTLRAVQVELEGQVARLEVDREAALSLAAEAPEELSVEGSEELMRISTRLEVSKRKLSDVVRRLGEAEGEMPAVLSAVVQRFAVMWRALLNWTIQREKTRLVEQLIAGCDILTIDRTVLHLRAVAGVRSLEVGGTEVDEVVAGCQRLLDVVTGCPGFELPVYTVSAPAASAEPQPEFVGLPFADRGMSIAEIEDKIKEIRLQNPGLDIAGSYAELKKQCPHLFVSQAEMLQMLDPLPALGSMVSETKAPMLGDTFSGCDGQIADIEII